MGLRSGGPLCIRRSVVHLQELRVRQSLEPIRLESAVRDGAMGHGCPPGRRPDLQLVADSFKCSMISSPLRIAWARKAASAASASPASNGSMSTR